MKLYATRNRHDSVSCGSVFPEWEEEYLEWFYEETSKLDGWMTHTAWEMLTEIQLPKGDRFCTEIDVNMNTGEITIVETWEGYNE